MSLNEYREMMASLEDRRKNCHSAFVVLQRERAMAQATGAPKETIDAYNTAIDLLDSRLKVLRNAIDRRARMAECEYFIDGSCKCPEGYECPLDAR